MDLIKKFIDHIFSEAELENDLKVLRLRTSIEEIVYKEGGY